MLDPYFTDVGVNVDTYFVDDALKVFTNSKTGWQTSRNGCLQQQTWKCHKARGDYLFLKNSIIIQVLWHYCNFIKLHQIIHWRYLTFLTMVINRISKSRNLMNSHLKLQICIIINIMMNTCRVIANSHISSSATFVPC